MKKLLVVSLVFILLAVSAVPGMAGNGSPNGHGNGVGHGNGGGNQSQNKDKEHGKSGDKGKNSTHGLGKFNNHQDNKWKYTPFYVQGVITVIGADSITVQVTHANAKARNFIDGGPMTIYVNDSTLLHVVNQGEDNEGENGEESGGESGEESGEGNPAKVPFTFDQLEVGQRVAVHGRLTTTDTNTEVYMARLVTVFLGAPEGQQSEP